MGLWKVVPEQPELISRGFQIIMVELLGVGEKNESRGILKSLVN